MKRLPLLLGILGLFLLIGLASSPEASAQDQETPTETPTAAPTPAETPTATPTLPEATNTPAPTSTPEPTSTPTASQPGDFNGDAVIDNEDVEAILMFFLTNQEPTAELLEIADINGDGRITPQDAQDVFLMIQ